MEKLKEIAPLVAVTTSRKRDEYYQWDGDGPDPSEDGYEVYDVTVEACAIVKGERAYGHHYLGGSYYQDDEPLGEIHGYLPQMVEEALVDLAKLTGSNPHLHGQVLAGIAFMRDVLQQLYDAQMKGPTT